MSPSERLLAISVLGPDRLGPLACPVLIELAEIDCEGALECMYWIRCYRVDEPDGVSGGWPFAATCREGVASVRQKVRMRWMEATLEELPSDVFEDGVGVAS